MARKGLSSRRVAVLKPETMALVLAKARENKPKTPDPLDGIGLGGLLVLGLGIGFGFGLTRVEPKPPEGSDPIPGRTQFDANTTVWSHCYYGSCKGESPRGECGCDCTSCRVMRKG